LRLHVELRGARETAWEAVVLPLNYARNDAIFRHSAAGVPTKTGTSVQVYHRGAAASTQSDRVHPQRMLAATPTASGSRRKVNEHAIEPMDDRQSARRPRSSRCRGKTRMARIRVPRRRVQWSHRRCKALEWSFPSILICIIEPSALLPSHYFSFAFCACRARRVRSSAVRPFAARRKSAISRGCLRMILVRSEATRPAIASSSSES